LVLRDAAACSCAGLMPSHHSLPVTCLSCNSIFTYEVSRSPQGGPHGAPSLFRYMNVLKGGKRRHAPLPYTLSSESALVPDQGHRRYHMQSCSPFSGSTQGHTEMPQEITGTHSDGKPPGTLFPLGGSISFTLLPPGSQNRGFGYLLPFTDIGRSYAELYLFRCGSITTLEQELQTTVGADSAIQHVHQACMLLVQELQPRSACCLSMSHSPGVITPTWVPVDSSKMQSLPDAP
jgi:hypothetical protein